MKFKAAVDGTPLAVRHSMRLILSILCVIFWMGTGSVHADSARHSALSAFSALRMPEETFHQARHRVIHRVQNQIVEGDSAWNSQSPLTQASFRSVPEVSSLAVLQEAFRRARDSRRWTWESMPGFSRRLPWLYPADGCFVRAEWVAEELVEWGLPRPKKVFVFGDLSYTLPYESGGWWYHVAPVLRFGGVPYVIDPAMDYQRPLPLREWLGRMSDAPESLNVAVCGAGTISPEDDCSADAFHWDRDDLDANLQNYLGLEWSNLESILGSSPEGILGDRPPWN